MQHTFCKVWRTMRGDSWNNGTVYLTASYCLLCGPMHQCTMCQCAPAACGGWCATTECSPCPTLHTRITIFIPPADKTAPSSCLKLDLQRAPHARIPPQLRCFSLGPLTASTTTPMPPHGESYERYVVCKPPSPHHSRHQLHFEPQYISAFSSLFVLTHTYTYTRAHRAKGWRKRMDVNHTPMGHNEQGQRCNRMVEGRRGHGSATNTPHSHCLIIGTEILIGCSGETGCVSARRVSQSRAKNAKVAHAWKWSSRALALPQRFGFELHKGKTQ